MAAPTRVQTAVHTLQDHVGTTTGTTTSFDVLNGDLLVTKASTEDASVTLTVSDNTGGALTWTLRQSDTTASHDAVYIWTAPINADRTGVTVTVTANAAGHVFGCRCTTWRNHGGVGTSNKATGTTAPTVTLTGVADNSAIDAICGDWNAGAATATWGGTAAATSESATQVATRSTSYHAFYADTGAAGSKTVSMASVPAGAATTIMAVEILAGATPSPPSTPHRMPLGV